MNITIKNILLTIPMSKQDLGSQTYSYSIAIPTAPLSTSSAATLIG